MPLIAVVSMRAPRLSKCKKKVEDVGKSPGRNCYQNLLLNSLSKHSHL